MNKLVFVIIMGIMLSVMASVYSDSVSEDIADGVVRLHIIANSDSENDRKIKIAVRDELIKAQREGRVQSISDAADIAQDTLFENGVTYGAAAMYGRYYFPSKEYKNIRMPAGMYRAVRVVLGDGGGQNWWCVMYPPLCFTEECAGDMSDSGIDVVRSGMNKESADIVTGSGAEIEMKFKIVETAQNIRRKYFSGE